MEDQGTEPAEKDAESTQVRGPSGIGAVKSNAPSHRRDGNTGSFRTSRSLGMPPPNPIEAWYYEGMAAYQHRRWDEALECFTRLKELQPDRPGLDALLDEVRWFRQLQAAAPMFDDLETLAPGRGRSVRNWWRRLAPLLTALLAILAVIGVASLLFAALQGWLPWQNGANKQEIEALFVQAQERQAAGDFDGAERTFGNILLISPGSSEAQRGIESVRRERELAQRYAAVTAAIADESWESASRELDAILGIDSDYKDARSLADFVVQRQLLAGLYEDGSGLYGDGNWDEALVQFERMREIDASYLAETVGNSLFACYIFAGQELIATQGADLGAVERAVDYFGRAFDLEPGNSVAAQASRLSSLYLAAMRAAADGETERARSQLTLLLAEDPSYAGGEVVHQLYKLTVAQGQRKLADGDIPAALELFEQAQALPVDDASAARNGYELAKIAAATPTPTAAPSPTPAPTSLPVVILPTPQPPVEMRATPTDTPVLVNCIYGHVYDAAGAAPLPEWIVTLTDAAGAAVRIYSGKTGQYRFDNLVPGVYELSVALPPSWRALSPQPTSVNVAPAPECVPVDFWNVRVPKEPPTPER